jgi:hypothetical protein
VAGVGVIGKVSSAIRQRDRDQAGRVMLMSIS